MNAAEPVVSAPSIEPDADAPSRLYPSLAPITAALRIGVLVDDCTVPAWTARIVEDIQNSGFARVILVIRNGERHDRPRWPARLRSRLRHLLYEYYSRRDIGRRRGPCSAFRPCDLLSLVAGAEWITVEPESRGHVHRFNAADILRIRAARPDVLLRFGFNILRGDILQAARHGVWSYHHGDSAQYRGGPAIFWEVYENNPLTGTVLQRLNEQLDGGEVLYRSHAATHPHSLELNREPTYWKSSTFVMRGLRSIADGRSLAGPPAGEWRKPLYRAPDNLQMSSFLCRVAARKARASIDDQLRVPHWFVAWRHVAEHTLLDPAAPRLGDMRPVDCPRGHYYADPFLHMHRGQPWLLIEDFDYRRDKGALAAIPWSGDNPADGPAGPARSMLDLDVHLSYPFVFCWRGETWLIPESAAARKVSLFRARSFPDRWEFVCDLLHGHRAVDATLHEHNGRWYLFANVCEAGGGTCDELFLFHAATPLGPFLPHPCNSIVSDVRRSRPAGRLFVHGGQLIRPAQDCARRYGTAVEFNVVTELSARHYQERPIGRLAGQWAPGLIGCHTYSRLGAIEVVDGNRMAARTSVGAPRRPDR